MEGKRQSEIMKLIKGASYFLCICYMKHKAYMKLSMEEIRFCAKKCSKDFVLNLNFGRPFCPCISLQFNASLLVLFHFHCRQSAEIYFF